MNPELYMVILPAVSWLLFGLGGTGYKWARRFVLPAIFGAACLPISIWQAAVVAGIGVGAFSLGYGETKPYWYKTLVGCGYALISIPIGISWWNLVTASGFIVLFKLSNTKATAKIFVWKLCEGFFGILVGVQLAYLLSGSGILWKF